MPEALDLDGQLAIVTGGTRGIGAAITRRFLQAGATVMATYRADHEHATALLRRCREQDPGAQLTLHAFDVADADAIQQLFDDLPRPPDVLVNNSGIRQDSLLGVMPQQAWDRVLQINLTGAFLMCKQAVRLMVGRRYGRIINITSPAGRHGVAGQANYAASKAGLVGMTRSLAREVACRGVTVNCVCPGLIQTDLIADLPSERLASLLKDVPMRRAGTPQEVAAAVLFLALPTSTYVTGAVLDVTGGL